MMLIRKNVPYVASPLFTSPGHSVSINNAITDTQRALIGHQGDSASKRIIIWTLSEHKQYNGEHQSIVMEAQTAKTASCGHLVSISTIMATQRA